MSNGRYSQVFTLARKQAFTAPTRGYSHHAMARREQDALGTGGLDETVLKHQEAGFGGTIADVTRPWLAPKVIWPRGCP